MSDIPETRTRPALFVFAHQDDEMVYMWRVRRLVEDGRDVRAVWVTDGAWKVPAEVRRRESTACMGVLGVGADALEFWEFPDAGVKDRLGEVVERLSLRMSDIGVSEVYTVAYEGGHPDHDLVHFACVTAAHRQAEPPSVYEAPLYNRHRKFPPAYNRHIPMETEVLYTPRRPGYICLKARALMKYRSQPWVNFLPALLLVHWQWMGPGEPYRVVPRWDYLEKPHSGRLGYEGYLSQRNLGITFEDYREAVRRVLDAEA